MKSGTNMAVGVSLWIWTAVISKYIHYVILSHLGEEDNL